jgi:hypothetical protein
MLTPTERDELIAKYIDGYNAVEESLENLSDEQLRAHPLPGKWSACEIVQHLADSETTSAIRLRRLLVEERPLIQGYDQDAFASRLRYNERDLAPALEALRSARASTAQLFAYMTEEDWQRTGEHSESGQYSVEDWLRIYAAHAHNHAAQIRALREKMLNNSD